MTGPIHLLIIDPQNDFCNPKGSLYVGDPENLETGAYADMDRLSNFILKNVDKINKITVTYDTHYNYDIAHPMFWTNSNGEHPKPVDTVISVQDVQNSIWTPVNPEETDWVLAYLSRLATTNRYAHRIWPPHCLQGTWGNNVDSRLMEAISVWEKVHKTNHEALRKGENPLVEHFSIVRAEVVDPNDIRGTGLNHAYVDSVAGAGKLVIAGEALDFCVASSVRDTLAHFGAEFGKRMALLLDCTSAVLPPDVLADGFVAECDEAGIELVRDCMKYDLGAVVV